MIEIPLTQGFFTVVDELDSDLSNQKWQVLSAGGKWYASRKVKKHRIQRTLLMHRIILERKLGQPIPDGMEVDHIDGNGLNNHRDNLRLATPAQNKHNTRKRSDNTSGVKGVHWKTRDKRWVATITVNGREKVLGYFRKLEDAKNARQKAAIELYGEFARHD